jgi:hypothetical protein
MFMQTMETTSNWNSTNPMQVMKCSLAHDLARSIPAEIVIWLNFGCQNFLLPVILNTYKLHNYYYWIIKQ